jgi:hypothetical protein
MDPKGAGSELQERRGAAPLLPYLLLLVALALGAATLAPSRPAAAAPTAPAQPVVSYARDIGPLFARWCLPCHAGNEPHGGLQLDSLVGVMRGGDTGPIVVPGKPADSLLVAKIERRHRPAMPPRRKLPASAVALVRAWIAAGAPE